MTCFTISIVFLSSLETIKYFLSFYGKQPSSDLTIAPLKVVFSFSVFVFRAIIRSNLRESGTYLVELMSSPEYQLSVKIYYKDFPSKHQFGRSYWSGYPSFAMEPCTDYFQSVTLDLFIPLWFDSRCKLRKASDQTSDSSFQDPLVPNIARMCKTDKARYEAVTNIDRHRHFFVHFVTFQTARQWTLKYAIEQKQSTIPHTCGEHRTRIRTNQ